MGTSVLDDKIYVIGGHSGHEYLDVVECYDPGTNEWSSIANMKSKRCTFGLVAL